LWHVQCAEDMFDTAPHAKVGTPRAPDYDLPTVACSWHVLVFSNANTLGLAHPQPVPPSIFKMQQDTLRETWGWFAVSLLVPPRGEKHSSHVATARIECCLAKHGHDCFEGAVDTYMLSQEADLCKLLGGLRWQRGA
jgi:hypothetical protein